MKKIIVLAGVFVITVLSLASCSLDNYDGPHETLYGSVIDVNKDEPLQTDITTNNGIRLKLMELSWSDNPTPYYFYAKQDGTFNNTKIFKAKYNIEPQGAFVPVVLTDKKGNVIADDSRTLEVKGKVRLDWRVEPFLEIDWVGDPVANADGTITTRFKIRRGTKNPDYQQKVTDIWLMINSSSPYVGENNKDDRYCVKLTGDAANQAFLKGGELTLTTVGKLSKTRTYYVRIGARIDCQIAGAKRFNFNEPKTVNF